MSKDKTTASTSKSPVVSQMVRPTGAVSEHSEGGKHNKGQALEPRAGEMTLEQAKLAKHELRVKEICGEIIKGTLAVAEKYFTLASYVRENQVPVSSASRWMIDMGMAKSRASEVCKVASASDKDWSAFAAKQIGWRGVLQLTRGNMEEMKRVNPAIVPPEVVKEVTAELVREEEELGPGVSDTPQTKAQKNAAKRAAQKLRMQKCAAAILQIAMSRDLRPKKNKEGAGVVDTFQLPNNNYVLTLSRKVPVQEIKSEPAE